MPKDSIIAPDFLIYEVVNAVWKHEYLLKDLHDGQPYLTILWGLIDSGKITLVSPNERLILTAYSIATKYGVTVYDAIFIALAIDLGIALKTFDKTQAQALEFEEQSKLE